ncbi:hypothetical protein, partial [Kistimonas scapharcae]|uniref:hypothetical protein n=1 Tax=Kistimonas scapharcae TaxID=1036133 RepID=UPI0031EE4CD4
KAKLCQCRSSGLCFCLVTNVKRQQLLEGEKNDLNARVQTIRRDIARKDREINNLNGRVDELVRSAEEGNRQLTALQREKQELQREKQEAEEEIEALEKKIPDESQCLICAKKSEDIVKLTCCEQNVGIGCLERHMRSRIGTPREERLPAEGLEGLACILSNPEDNPHVVTLNPA